MPTSVIINSSLPNPVMDFQKISLYFMHPLFQRISCFAGRSFYAFFTFFLPDFFLFFHSFSSPVSMPTKQPMLFFFLILNTHFSSA
ncbi:MAG: hypothetical protein CR997_06040 [Acidobacteria bacterium]|nr:MAG: hypothetical protein CR997_06040 [Acidobacteriota bacterium]